MGKIKEVSQNITELTEETYKFPVDKFKDEETKIGILKLQTMQGLIALGDDYFKVLVDEFDNVVINEDFCKYKQEDENCTLTYHEFYQIFQNSKDADEILHFWKETRERNLKEVTQKTKIYIEMYKKLGEKYQKSAKFAWYADYLDENFGYEMENVINEMQPLYKEIHAYIRHQLHNKYGDVVPNSGLIPHHMYEHAITQAWKPDSIISEEFKGIPTVDHEFNGTANEVIEISSNFMKSLGFSEIEQDFWSERVRENKNKGNDCSATIFDSGNTPYFMYCNEVNIRRFIQMHGYIARLYYANERKDIPFAYTEPYNLELATGEAVILSTTTPKYLHKIGLKDNNDLTEEEHLNRLFRMGVHTILRIPEYFVNVKVFADVLDNTIPFENINTHYWELMKKYVGVAAPIERTTGSIDLSFNFYEKIESNQQTVKFASEVMGYQIYESLCKKSEEFVKDNKNHQLHKCNLYDSKEAGLILKQMMQWGSKKPWKQLLGIVTGDNSGMKAEAMLEYYEPLLKLLQLKNTKRNVVVGW